MNNIITLKSFSIVIILCFFYGEVFASCIGATPVWGTNDTKASCADKQAGRPPAPRLQTQQQAPPQTQQQTQQPAAVTQGPGSNFFMNGFQPGTPSSEIQQPTDGSLILTVHQVRFEWAPYVIPGAYQFDEPGMPENLMPRGLAWEYFFNKTVGVGLLFQEFSKTGGKEFDDIKHSYTDASGDTHTSVISSPGDLHRLKYRIIIPYVSITGKLAPDWALGGRAGIGRVQVEAEYKNAANVEHIDNSGLLFDLFVEKWYTGMKVGGSLRYINARSDTSDYTKYINLGSAQVVFYVQIMLKNLGLL